MNYQNHYDMLITKAANRVLENSQYVELHHIIPKCAGGTDESSNIVSLLPEEHFLAHQLLVKIYEKIDKQTTKKLLYSLNLMSGKSNLHRSNKYYGWIRRRVSESRKGYKPTQVTLDKISEKVKLYYEQNISHRKGIPNSKEQKEKISKTLMGRKHTWGDKISKALKGKPKSEEHRKKLKGKNNPAYKVVDNYTQRKIVESYIKGLSILQICDKYNYSEGKIQSILIDQNINYSIRICPHCNKEGQAGNMLRWHFDNCKNIILQ